MGRGRPGGRVGCRVPEGQVPAGTGRRGFLLARGAEANARRILAAGDGRFIGSVFSVGSWALVVMMMFLGSRLRDSSLPRPWLGLIYTAVGVALVRASVVSWGHWRRKRR